MSVSASAYAEIDNEEYLKVKKDSNGNLLSLDTSILSLTTNNKDYSSIQVDLISALHIADKSYYEKLNSEFKDYESVLFELVSNSPYEVKKKSNGSNPLTDTQIKMKNLLNLNFQLEEINYQASNFTHADLSPEELRDEMIKRDENALKILMKLSSLSLDKEYKSKSNLNQLNLFLNLFIYSPATALKRSLASSFENLNKFTELMSSSSLISGRNDKALSVLEEQIQNGKKKVAIFYGAGHMPDLYEKLSRKYNFRVNNIRWIKAWSLQ